MKGCPLLVQSDTSPMMTVPGESHTRSYLLECLGEKCAAFFNGTCKKYFTAVSETNAQLSKQEEQSQGQNLQAQKRFERLKSAMLASGVDDVEAYSTSAGTSLECRHCPVYIDNGNECLYVSDCSGTLKFWIENGIPEREEEP